MNRVSIFLLLFFFTHTQSSKLNKSVNVALYVDRGADADCIQATQNMFEWMSYTVQLVTSDYINNVGLDNFDILCIPGGNMYEYSEDISSVGKENIKNFIRNGGGYIGICGGAYFTGEKVFWQGEQLSMTPLGIFPGTTKGPIEAIALYPYCTMCEVNIAYHSHPITQSLQDSIWIRYCYGPEFLPNQDADIDILGTYDIEGKPAIITFEYGLGKVFIIGTHPEFEEDSDRDGFPPNDELYDRGSDWELMRRVAEWCLSP